MEEKRRVHFHVIAKFYDVISLQEGYWETNYLPLCPPVAKSTDVLFFEGGKGDCISQKFPVIMCFNSLRNENFLSNFNVFLNRSEIL